ncbi:MAG: cupredoxin domain-containing protein [Rubrivivax sp.]
MTGRRAFTFTLASALAGMAGRSAAAATVDVEIKGNLFLPEAVTVRAGDTVRWTNKERRTTHSVLFPAESLESERLLPDDPWSRRFDKPGRYPYTCGPHPEMKGLVVVTE